MRTYILKETLKGSKYLYEVFDNENNYIGGRLSSRQYIACLIDESSTSKDKTLGTWFGRVDLIGKGDSRHYINRPHVKVVYAKGGKMADLLHQASVIKIAHGICPKLNDVVTEIAKLICEELKQFDKKTFDAAITEAIEKVGYSFHYYDTAMRKIGPEHVEDF